MSRSKPGLWSRPHSQGDKIETRLELPKRRRVPSHSKCLSRSGRVSRRKPVSSLFCQISLTASATTGGCTRGERPGCGQYLLNMRTAGETRPRSWKTM